MVEVKWRQGTDHVVIGCSDRLLRERWNKAVASGGRDDPQFVHEIKTVSSSIIDWI
jgi:hypothetical protein